MSIATLAGLLVISQECRYIFAVKYLHFEFIQHTVFIMKGITSASYNRAYQDAVLYSVDSEWSLAMFRGLRFLQTTVNGRGYMLKIIFNIIIRVVLLTEFH